MHNVSDMHTSKGKKQNSMWWKPWAFVKDWREAGVPDRRVTGSTFFKWQDWSRVQGGASESSAQSRTWREPVRKKIAFNCLKFSFAREEGLRCRRDAPPPTEMQSYKSNKCRFLLLFLNSQNRRAARGPSIWNGQCICSTKILGTAEYKYIYETRPALPIYSFSFFFSRRLSRGCQSERKWRRLMQRHQVKQYSSTAGRAAPCCTELLCYSRTSTDKLNAPGTVN